MTPLKDDELEVVSGGNNGSTETLVQCTNPGCGRMELISRIDSNGYCAVCQNKHLVSRGAIY